MTAETLAARKAYERGEFLASTDERFRPVYLSDAPDGTLYIVDMYRGILEHRLSMTEYLRDQILARQLEQPTGMGRIYRVDARDHAARHGAAAVERHCLAARGAALASRTAGGATPAQRLHRRARRSVRRAVHCRVSRRPPATGAPGCMRSGPSMASTRWTRRPWSARWRIRIATCARPRSGSRNAGSAKRVRRSRPRCCVASTIGIGRCGNSSQRRLACCRKARARARRDEGARTIRR